MFFIVLSFYRRVRLIPFVPFIISCYDIRAIQMTSQHIDIAGFYVTIDPRGCVAPEQACRHRIRNIAKSFI